MARKKSSIKCLLISNPKTFDNLELIIREINSKNDFSIHLDIHTPQYRNVVALERPVVEKDFNNAINICDLVFVDFENVPIFTFYEIGIARAIGKPIIYLINNFEYPTLPSFITKSYSLSLNKEGLENRLNSFFSEFIENPIRFSPSRILGSESKSQIIVDLDKLEQHDFENLCVELLSRLGYKQLEWQMKDEYIDAVTTLKKQDPDGFEYNELWLVSFKKNFNQDKLLQSALHEPEYFLDHIYRSLFRSDLLDHNSISVEKRDSPITLLFIIREKENYSKNLIKEFSKKSHRLNKRGTTISIRIRWWDEQTITSLVQNNIQLARKYFSSEALVRSNVRLSYEELYQQYADMNEELQKTNKVLQKTNETLISERNKIELLERDAAWKLLSFTAAHRLGNPMDAIDSDISNLKSALKQGKLEIVDEIIENIEIPVERAKSIISEFRNLSIAKEIKTEIVDSEKLQETLKYSAKKAIDKNVQVDFDIKTVPNVNIDVKKVSDCFEEIVRNSLHYLNGDENSISISLNKSTKEELPEKIDNRNEYIKITFSDNGEGVPFERKKEIFKPFETSYIHGTGLGLAFCESIFEAHNGTIREVGKPTVGAVFEIFLPICNDKYLIK